MTDSTVISTKLCIKYEKGSYSNAKVHDFASINEILALEKAINSIQSKPATRFTKIVTSQLTTTA